MEQKRKKAAGGDHERNTDRNTMRSVRTAAVGRRRRGIGMTRVEVVGCTVRLMPAVRHPIVCITIVYSYNTGFNVNYKEAKIM